VSLLSGGEKTLTSLALLVALFQVRPSPFFLLDEVDAALDDANVGRFNEIVKEMSEGSQFVVITHNKRTIEICDVLYGVTMENRGVSTLVSVELH
jgi:chromosome segregation protein